MKRTTFTRILLIIGIPVLYALALRFIFDLDIFRDFIQVMSITFFFSLPFGIGAITIALSPLEKVQKRSYCIFMPWAAILVFFSITLAIALEGFACWLMMLPVFLIFASMGGITAAYFKIRKSKKRQNIRVSLLFALPFIIAIFENYLPKIPSTYEAYTCADISADKEKIWNHVTRVKEISTAEDKGSLTNFLGFPRPVKAELDIEAVGGSRKAIFSKGLVFDEVVKVYTHQQLMQFSIKANPYNIPSATMDKHILIGGDYFDVLDGTYRLEQLDKNTWRLHLLSHFTLNTTFNFYASCWARWIMKDIQNNILQVIKARCELE